ncbi:hypothetical protein N7468_000670 [Penicillium chermesinum]|uniref:Aldehyde dehydrogenase n=1 Tax=Penicillium chermesinum TaxID=63820 RepID=A0A9W9PNS2_9EURO|nr:uncharacterized protein N7468_000670 [Penicillium chermesinum]KAJ5249219.1 hypothetical protein N7468_000670 [Penicillium chermesinum]KAJ6151314.1 hypothetical protein N7470_007908 [Penicillium chermesinum]
MGFSTAAEFDQAYHTVQDTFASGATKDKGWRRQQLKRTWWMIEDNRDRLCAALYTDLHRHRQESIIADIGMLQKDILHTLQNLDKWTQDEIPTRWDPVNFLGNTRVRKEPKGVALIIGAWNYPILLTLQPMVAAIAAGCAIIVKPSDMALACQDVLVDIIPQYLDTSAVLVVTAGAQEMQHILDRPFDHIFYTGSGSVGKIIYAAAAKHLTPVTLELGGQAPAIVTPAADIDLSAKHIAATKFQNAGQICLNVNHVIVDPTVREAFVEKLGQYFDTFLGGRDNRPDYYTHIINERNFDRLDRLLRESSGQIVYGGQRDRATRFFAPTIVTGVQPSDSLFSEELFGPILPILDADLDGAFSITRKTGRPLGIYAFTHSEAEKRRVLNETQSGGVTFNDCTLHVLPSDAPFGGTGTSGFGYYHGPHGVREFSHLRTYINAMPSWVEGLLSARYPPYSLEKTNALSPKVTPPFDRDGNDVPSNLTKWAFGLGTLALSGAVYQQRQQLLSIASKFVQ